jgi:hypothetical protein
MVLTHSIAPRRRLKTSGPKNALTTKDSPIEHPDTTKEPDDSSVMKRKTRKTKHAADKDNTQNLTPTCWSIIASQ